MKLRTSTEIGSIASYVGEARAVEWVAEAGFDCFDFTMLSMARYDYGARGVRRDYFHPLKDGNPIGFARHIRRLAASMGITCNQSHAPFPVACDEIRRVLPLALECTAEAGGKLCVIHPNNHLSAKENAVMYRELLPVAHAVGVKIAAENMWNRAGWGMPVTAAACSHHTDFLRHIEEIDDPYFVACLDIGHAGMQGLDTTAVEMIRTLGAHLQALHIHDNDRFDDLHRLPYTMQIDFDEVLRTLAACGYRGDLTLEADRALVAQYPHDIHEGVMEMGRVAKRLQTQYDILTKEWV